MTVQKKNYRAQHIVDKLDQGQLCFPPWHRKQVWQKNYRQVLIDSMLRGLYVSPVYFGKIVNPELSEKDDPRIRVIDGRQRIETISMFMKDEFKTARVSYGKDMPCIQPNKYYSEMEPRYQRMIEDFPVNSNTIYFPDKSELREQYRRLNSGLSWQGMK